MATMGESQKSTNGFELNSSFEFFLNTSFDLSRARITEADYHMLLDKSAEVRGKYEEFLFQQADQMDEMVRQNEANQAQMKHDVDLQMEELKRVIASRLDEIEELKNERTTQDASIAQFNSFFNSIRNQINQFIDDLNNNNKRSQEFSDIVELSDNESESNENTVPADAKNADTQGEEEEDVDANMEEIREKNEEEEDAEEEENIEQDASNEEDAAADDDVNVVHNDVGSGKENVRPQSTPIAAAVSQAKTVSADSQNPFVPPMPAAASMDPLVENRNYQNVRGPSVNCIRMIRADNSMIVRDKQCFRCEEMFVKETSLVNHMRYEHGIDIKNLSEPGQFVRAPKKRKIVAAENEVDDYEVPCQESSMKINPMKQAIKRSKMNKR